MRHNRFLQKVFESKFLFLNSYKNLLDFFVKWERRKKNRFYFTPVFFSQTSRHAFRKRKNIFAHCISIKSWFKFIPLHIILCFKLYVINFTIYCLLYQTIEIAESLKTDPQVTRCNILTWLLHLCMPFTVEVFPM